MKHRPRLESPDSPDSPESPNSPDLSHRPQAPRWAAALGWWAVLALPGCVSWQPPQPWEKGELARPVMRMDTDPLEARFSAHTYFSKEAASGGGGVGGGGCGCN